MAVASSSPDSLVGRPAFAAGSSIVVAAWGCLIVLLSATALLQEPGPHLISGTIHIVLLFYFLSCALALCRRPPAWSEADYWRTVRACWTVGWITFVVHVLCALGFYHNWDHAHAV